MNRRSCGAVAPRSKPSAPGGPSRIGASGLARSSTGRVIGTECSSTGRDSGRGAGPRGSGSGEDGSSGRSARPARGMGSSSGIDGSGSGAPPAGRASSSSGSRLSGPSGLGRSDDAGVRRRSCVTSRVWRGEPWWQRRLIAGERLRGAAVVSAWDPFRGSMLGGEASGRRCRDDTSGRAQPSTTQRSRGRALSTIGPESPHTTMSSIRTP